MNNLEKLEELKCYLEDQEIAIGDTYSLLKFNMMDELTISEIWLEQLVNMIEQTNSMIDILESILGD